MEHIAGENIAGENCDVLSLCNTDEYCSIQLDSIKRGFREAPHTLIYRADHDFKQTVECFYHIGEILKRYSELKSLRIECSSYPREHDAVLEALCDPDHLSHLESFTIAFTRAAMYINPFHASSLLRMVETNRSLKKIGLMNVHVNLGDLGAALEKNSTLRSLVLMGVKGDTTPMFAGRSFPFIEKLKICNSGFKYGDPGMDCLCGSCGIEHVHGFNFALVQAPSLKKLTLDSVRFADGGSSLSSLPPSLEALHLSKCEIVLHESDVCEHPQLKYMTKDGKVLIDSRV